MSNQQIGAALMALPLLWFAYQILRAKDGKFSVNLITLIVAVTCFVAGRLVAGKSAITMLLN